MMLVDPPCSVSVTRRVVDKTDLGMDAEGHTECVETRAEVGTRRRDANDHRRPAFTLRRLATS
jgi:hypothetical protein